MKFSVNWLREFVDLPEKIDDLVDLLTMAGVEIEGIISRGVNVPKIIVGQIVASSQHPNADRLSVCEVDDGSPIKRQIVCGATNYKVGDKVSLAIPGARLPNGTEIRKSKLRGVESEGMLCSAIELGVGEDSAGLLILSPEAKVGAPIADLFPNDTILDVEITPNRGDLLSHYGLAREIAALTAQKLRGPIQAKAGETPALQHSGVKISAPHECPFYSLWRIENVKVGPSPEWLRAKIESVGIRSINNIVDISNFVMLELGQPTHAFDADKLSGEEDVRLARDGEKFLALDGKTYSLTERHLVIADAQKAVGIGGVMGGEETGVSDSTKNVLLESAYFLPSSIRRTARTLSLPSDASYRFERGVDPQMILPASQRATELIREIAGGSPAQEINAAGTLLENPPNVSLRYEKCNQLLGVTIEAKAVDRTLEQFGLHKNGNDEANMRPEEGATFTIPSFRRDLQRDVDLIEEVVRAYGVQKIAGTNRSSFSPSSAADLALDREARARERLLARGLDEVRTSKLIGRNALFFGDKPIEVRNPLSEDHVALRPWVITGLLNVLERNIRAGAERVAIFEIGRVFLPPVGTEERHLGLLLWGNAASDPHWRADMKRRLDFADLKGAIEVVSKAPLSFRRVQYGDFALAVDVSGGGQTIGLAGQLVAARTAKLGATGAVFVAELNLESLLAADFAAPVFREIDRYPAVQRDIAMIVPDELTHAEIADVIRTSKEPLLQSVELFDLFADSEKSGIGAGRKSLAYKLTYRDKNRTLTGEEVTAAHARIRERLQSELGAELRE